MPAGQPDGGERHEPPILSPAAVRDGARDDVHPFGQRAGHREAQSPRAAAARHFEHAWVVGVDHHRVVARLVREDARLGTGVLLETPVAVEVIGRQVETDRDPGPERRRELELETAHFDDVDHVRRRIFDLAAQRQADVSADESPVPTGVEHPAAQRGGGRLALRAGDGDDPPAKPAGGHLDLADDRDAGGASAGDDRDPRRHARAQHDQIGRVERRGPVPAELHPDAETSERRHPRGVRGGRKRLAHRHASAASRGQRRGREAAAGGADHDDVRSGHRELGHRSFRVVRLNNAKTTAMIRNRVMIFGSLHPTSS